VGLVFGLLGRGCYSMGPRKYLGAFPSCDVGPRARSGVLRRPPPEARGSPIYAARAHLTSASQRPFARAPPAQQLGERNGREAVDRDRREKGEHGLALPQCRRSSTRRRSEHASARQPARTSPGRPSQRARAHAASVSQAPEPGPPRLRKGGGGLGRQQTVALPSIWVAVW
jgi:hypothetical protein